jgi:hypothetical protein
LNSYGPSIFGDEFLETDEGQGTHEEQIGEDGEIINGGVNEYAIEDGEMGGMGGVFEVEDYEGDGQNGILTIPVLYGKSKTWKIAFCILSMNLLSNSLFIYKLYSIRESIFFLLICSQLYMKLIQIKTTNYEKNIIKNSVDDTQKQLFAVLLYICFLRTIK